MDERFPLLRQDIEAERSAIARIFEALHQLDADLQDSKNVIVIGYHLHNLYNAFENIFRLVADAFENHVPDPSRWHTLLLERMARDIENLRPRLIGEAALRSLDELRRFRHIFRHVYHHQLDSEGVTRALTEAYRLEAAYQDDLETFAAFLEQLSSAQG